MTTLAPKRELNLMLAAGDTRVDVNDYRLDIEPSALGNRHAPMAHRQLIDTVENSLENFGYGIAQSVHALSGDKGERYFGLMEVQGTDTNSDFSTVIGFRAAHDQRYAVGLVGGSGVFVCSNLCFFGEVKLARKHTAGMISELPTLVHEAVAKLDAGARNQSIDFDNMKSAQLKESWANSLITKMVREGVIAASSIPKIIEEYDTPSHDEFLENGHTVWTMFNAVTEAYKPKTESGNSIGTLVDRSPKLYDFCKRNAAAIAA